VKPPDKKRLDHIQRLEDRNLPRPKKFPRAGHYSLMLADPPFNRAGNITGKET
jgi:hypothetical protein